MLTGADTLAAAAARDALLRCWVRERAVALPAGGPVSIPASMPVETTVEYRSETGHHRFGPVSLGGRPVVAAAELARLLVGAGSAGDDLVERVGDSARRIERYLAARRAEGCRTGTDAFLAAEQDLLLGHLLHPAAKSRDGLPDDADASYAPELRGRFPLHWFAVDPGLVDSGEIAGHPALGSGLVDLMRELSGIGDGRIPVPAHPWQAADLATRPAFAALLDRGLVTPLGPAGPDWWPTSSLRTVYRPDVPVMLKLSLGLRITNSRRENTRTELARGLEVHRLLAGGIDAAVRAAYPRFRIVRDPGYLAVPAPDGSPTGLDVSVREAPAGLAGARCLAGLVAPQPGVRPAALVSLVESLATGTGRPVAAVAADWVRRYVDTVLAPMVLLYTTTGIGLEAHQQNTLVVLDERGWPDTGWYRDNQGYYLAASALPDVLRRTGAGITTLALAPDAVVADRLTYYLLFNQALAPVAALGSAGVAAERDLLAAVRDGLTAIVARGHDTARDGLTALASHGASGTSQDGLAGLVAGGREAGDTARDGLVARWLSAETLPCKANLATRLAGIDEVLAPVDNQSVYLRVPNPLRAAS